MHCPDESDALGFLEKGDALLQALHIDYSRAGIARIAYPTAKCPGVVTMVEMEFFDRLAAALAKTVLRFRRTVFFARWRSGRPGKRSTCAQYPACACVPSPPAHAMFPG